MPEDRIQKLDALGFEWNGQLFWRNKEEVVMSSDENTPPDEDPIEDDDDTEFLPSTKKRKRTEKCSSEGLPKFIQEKRISMPSNEEISIIDEFTIIQCKEL